MQINICADINIMLLPLTCKHIQKHMICASRCRRAQRGACRGHVACVGRCWWLSLNHLNDYGNSAVSPPYESPKYAVRRCLSGNRWNIGSSLARLSPSPSLIMRSRSKRVQRYESVLFFKIPKSNYPGARMDYVF